MRRFGQRSTDDTNTWIVSFDSAGIHLSQEGQGQRCESKELAGFIAQLADDNLATADAGDRHIGWPAFYEAVDSGHYPGLTDALSLPPVTRRSPVLESRGSLSDPDFAISVRGWVAAGERIVHPERVGGVLVRGSDKELLSPRHWDLCVAMATFSERDAAERSLRANQLAWGQIRELALRAGANLDNFLSRSVVLAPETLKLHLRRTRLHDGDSVVEIEPDFDEAPAGWLELFDKWDMVRDEYHLPTPEGGMVQVLVKPEVQTVLREIKRMPGRRMAGARAQAFVLNPYAALGQDAQSVVDEKQFDDARAQAGLDYERFTPVVEHDGDGSIRRVGVLIESVDPSGNAKSERDWLTQDRLEAFLRKLQLALDSNYTLLAWGGFDLELQDTAYGYLEELQAVLLEWRGLPQFVSWDDVYDIKRYSPRIEGIGEERFFYSPYIVKKERGEWVPEDIAFGIGCQPAAGGEPVIAQFNLNQVGILRERIDAARRDGADAVDVPGLPAPIKIAEADRLVEDFKNAGSKIGKRDFPPGRKDESESSDGRKRIVRQTLLLRANIQQLDYEQRRKKLVDVPETPVLPSSLLAKYGLFDHQKKGLAWLQHLYRSRLDLGVGGAVLADDMGLGKTLQLLAFMARLVEENPAIDPMLVVAPVALLQNWKQELEQFFEPGTLPLLVAYGSELDDLKVPRNAIEQRLREDAGLVNFLRPNWVGGAKLVLTTYETLRNLEFSFAPQAWSVMICDEAQKIKNPAAMVTRAAKKQKADFKVACTGTPVENTLADLWCLYDFIQPGLLGALDEFGKRYRKPIEARTDEERARVEELRELIRPQILRRTKVQVADGLPEKIVASRCRKLDISMRQRQLYAKAVHDFKRRDQPDVHVPFRNHLGLLYYLRLLCTDPRPYGGVPTLDRPLADYRTDAPKMDWLIDRLRDIRKQSEKVIVFCEFRGIQRLLKYYIRDGLGYDADIINGDTTPDIARADSRQKRIDAFQVRPGFGVIILSPMAVGFGLNIQAANHVVHYTRAWNPAKEDQATDRAYRIGQKRDVHVYYPVVTASDFTTFDAQLDVLLEHKRQLATDMLNGSGDIGADDFSGINIAPPGVGANLDPRIDMDAVRELSGRYFEGLVAALWAKKETAMTVCTPASGDKGVDVVAMSGGKGWLIQTKVSSSAQEVGLGWDAVKEVTGGEAYYREQYPGIAFDKFCVTNQRFNTDAHKLAKLNRVTLVEGRELQKLLKKYVVRQSEVEALLYTSPYSKEA